MTANHASKLKARPTVYKGIQMRSRLEAGFAVWLDRHHFEWEYEPCAFATEEGQYLPDFQLSNVFAAWLPRPVTMYIEVKPESYCVHPYLDSIAPGDWGEYDRLQQQATIISSAAPDGLLIVAQPNRGLRLMVEDAYPSPYVNRAWIPCGLGLIGLPADRVGFCCKNVDRPWSGEYWKPGKP